MNFGLTILLRIFEDILDLKIMHGGMAITLVIRGITLVHDQ